MRHKVHNASIIHLCHVFIWHFPSTLNGVFRHVFMTGIYHEPRKELNLGINMYTHKVCY